MMADDGMDREFMDLIDDALITIRRRDLPKHSHNCPHCGLMITYPVVARRQDIEDFRIVMQAIYEVMDRHGISANLLADVHAEIVCAAARLGTREG